MSIIICLVCGVTFDIDTGSHKPFNIPPCHTYVKEREVIEEHIKTCLVSSGYLAIKLHFKGLWI